MVILRDLPKFIWLDEAEVTFKKLLHPIHLILGPKREIIMTPLPTLPFPI